MFGIFKRRRRAAPRGTTPTGPLAFKSGTAALEYACKFMECPLRTGVSLPAVVLDSRTHFDMRTAVKVQPDGNQVAALRVAAEGGGFIVLATTAGPRGPRLQPGQLVVWHAMTYDSDLAQTGTDRRLGWVGLIIGTLRPEYRDGEWVGDDRFTPMAERFFNWEGHPAIVRDTLVGGMEALFVPSDTSKWCRAHPAEVLESGVELSEGKFSQMFPDAPQIPTVAR